MSTSSLGATDELAVPPVGPAPVVAEIRHGRWGDIWRAISGNRKALVAVLVLLLFVVRAIFPGHRAPYGEQAQLFQPARPASWHHLFGPPAYGQDIFSQVVWGTRL